LNRQGAKVAKFFKELKNGSYSGMGTDVFIGCGA